MDLAGIIEIVNAKFGEGFGSIDEEVSTDTVRLTPEKWGQLAPFLRETPELFFDAMMCITGIDEGVESENLAVIYNLHSMKHNHKLEIYVSMPKSDPKVPSVEQIWRVADWFEREVFDMYGIEFDGHRDLRRICFQATGKVFPFEKITNFLKRGTE